ncbi:sigma-54-dependent Fis family transcriptional regulator [Thermosinus carboxydivorans]|uniref:sigma-54-dependent Fis family transcriptional regulator n=1 Tax=Thermosinus carboxydivorans TaxID=261685 RepID=UPI000681CF66|nr:sigma-54-dependent Fis family transcriptional regulator [Thermosinus carboxydivorans]
MIIDYHIGLTCEGEYAANLLKELYLSVNCYRLKLSGLVMGRSLLVIHLKKQFKPCLAASSTVTMPPTATGIPDGKPGLFELAHGGTIFLDEIGEIAPSLQARLLRVLQEKEIMRVGGDKIIPIDIRIISATNKDLNRRVEQGEFREDLYYRLNVLKITLPPLRERPEDILPLAMYFLQKRLGPGIDYNRAAQELAPLLMAYNWPGNIRELSNFMERLAVLAAHFPVPAWRDMLQKVINAPLNEDDSITVRVNLSGSLKEAVSQVEKKIIEILLEKSGKDYEQVAKRLGIGRTTLWRKQGGTEFPKMKK